MNDTKALVKSNGKAVAVPDDPDADNFVVPGMENIRPDELRIPLLKLVQAQSRVEGAQDHLGWWHNSVTGEFLQSPELLIIGVARGRVMFPLTYNAENKPLCGSDNGEAPRPEYVGSTIKLVGQDANGEPVVVSNVIPKACADCPFGKWGDNSEPPRCNEVATFAGFDANGMPVLIQIKSTGMRNVPSLKTLIAANGIRKSIKLGSVKETNDSGVYYLPVFTVGGKPDTEWQANALRLARMGNLAARNQQAIIEYEKRQEESAGPAWNDDDETSWDSEADIPF